MILSDIIYLVTGMKMIGKNLTNEFIIKNSRFICFLYRLERKEDIINYLNEVKEQYPKATHYCYAYVFQDIKKASDDGEPAKTAGMPILNVLEKEEFTNILCIVVRYFGGIKLGAGGLVRAYSKSVHECLKKATFHHLIKAFLIEIRTDYSNLKELNYLLKDQEIISKEFKEEVIYQVNVDPSFLPILEKKNFSFLIIKNTFIEKGIDFN